MQYQLEHGIALTDDQIIDKIMIEDPIATEGAKDFVAAVWKKLRELVLFILDAVGRVWRNLTSRAQMMLNGITSTRNALLKIDNQKFGEFLKKPINPGATEAFNPETRTVAIPKDIMVKVLKDYEKAAQYVEKYSKTVQDKVKALDLPNKIKSAHTVDELKALQNELTSIVRSRQEIVKTIVVDLMQKCPSLKIEDRGDRLDIQSCTIPEMNNACTYAEIGYKTENDVRECLDLFTSILMNGYRKSTTPYDFVKEFEAMRHDLEKVALETQSPEAAQLAASIMNQLIGWIRTLESISLRIDKNQMDTINTGYNFIKNSIVNFSSWNWRAA